MQDFVSIIIPTYNRAGFIQESVQSVLQQTYPHFELIVVDDGSTDKTAQAVRQFGNRITYIQQEQKGPSAARNTGIRFGRGEWISFLDSDDLWLPQKLEKQIDFFHHHPTAKICYTEETWYRKGKRVNPGKKHRKYSGWIYQKMLPLCLVSASSVIIHRSVFDIVGLFDESLPACEDYDLWLRIGALFPFFLLTEQLTIKRNGHKGQQSQKYWGMDRFRIKALQKMLDCHYLNQDDWQVTFEMLEKKCNIIAMGCKKRGKFTEVMQYQSIVHAYKEKMNEYSLSRNPTATN